MSDNWLTEWSEKKISIAQNLNDGKCGGSYAEAVIILCSVLSGIAADLWPGKFKDRVRFVELLISYAEKSLDVKKISIPLLIGELRDSGYKEESEILFKEFMPSCKTLVITGDDVDKSIKDIISICPSLPIKLVKENCYAHILYKEVRSGYVHEYMPGERSDSWGMGSVRSKDKISYSNRGDKPDRLIYYSVNWLVMLVRSVVKTIEDSSASPDDGSFDDWWLKNNET
ncbi:MAG: hypothetical protein ABW096_07955 [Candidatus Thiodiazotropha sp.]